MYTLNFTGNINTSIQVGDLVYSTPLPISIGISVPGSGAGSSGNSIINTTSSYTLHGEVVDIILFNNDGTPIKLQLKDIIII